MTAPYDSGVIAIQNGNTAVVGTGTSWELSGISGGLLIYLGITGFVASVEDDTHLTLKRPWPGPSGSGVYDIYLENAEAASVVDLYSRITKALRTLSLAGIKPDDLGTLAYMDTLESALGLNAESKFIFLHAEIGVAFAYYVWDGPADTDWQGPFGIIEEGEPGPSGVGDKFDLGLFISGRPRASELVMRHVFSGSADVTFPAGLGTSEASAVTEADDSAVFTVSLNGTPVATITFAASADEGTFIAGSPIGAIEGDILTVTAPTVQDLTLSDVSITLAGVRS